MSAVNSAIEKATSQLEYFELCLAQAKTDLNNLVNQKRYFFYISFSILTEDRILETALANQQSSFPDLDVNIDANFLSNPNIRDSYDNLLPNLNLPGNSHLRSLLTFLTLVAPVTIEEILEKNSIGLPNPLLTNNPNSTDNLPNANTNKMMEPFSQTPMRPKCLLLIYRFD